MVDAQSLAKRGSSPGAEEEYWRDLGLEVPRRLLVVSTVNLGLTEAETAHGKLAVRADRMPVVLFALGALPIGHVDVASLAASNPAFEGGSFSTEALEGARREIARFGATHRAVCRLFALYAARLGLLQGAAAGDDPRCRSWEEHRAEAERRYDAAARRVLSALAQVQAGRDILFMVIQAPAQYLAFAMAPAVQQCALRARDEATLTVHELRELRHAVILEFFDAWAALSLRR